jgi:hypothetical protein
LTKSPCFLEWKRGDFRLKTVHFYLDFARKMAVFCLSTVVSTVVSTVLVLATVLDFQHSFSTVLPRYPNFLTKNKKTGELLQEV